MDRIPLPPPFIVGTCVRYRGRRRAWADAAMTVPLIGYGMEFTIVGAAAGRRGTLEPLPLEDGDDEDEPVLDSTVDGYSVYQETPDSRRIIWPKDFLEWEVV